MSDFQHNLHFTSDDPPIKGFQEIIFSVSNLEKMIDFFQRICGWEVVSRNKGSDELKQLWHLDATVEIEEVLMQNPKDIEGFLRLVQFNNVEQQQIRSGTSTWDSGGIFDINMRTKDMDVMYRTLQREGWNGYTDPVRYVFDIYDVSEVLVKGPDGITIAFMQRFAPPLVGYDHFVVTSRIFNSSIISKDLKTTRDFFVNKLGFELKFETLGNERKGELNVLGFPRNMNSQISVPIDIVHPDIKNTGSIEYLEPKEFKGKDCSDLGKPPNLGILMYRFPVRDVDAYAATLQERRVVLNSKVQTLEVAPYGKLKIFSVVSPDGAWIEFVEQM